LPLLLGSEHSGKLSVDVTNSLCPPSNMAEDGSIVALKRCAHDFTHQQTTHDYDAGLSYLESADTYKYDTLAIGRMIAQ
jgi:hypothetical protein